MKISIDPQLSINNNDPMNFFEEEACGVAQLDAQPTLVAEEEEEFEEDGDEEYEEDDDEEYEYEEGDEEEYEYEDDDDGEEAGDDEYEYEEDDGEETEDDDEYEYCLLYTSPSPRDRG